LANSEFGFRPDAEKLQRLFFKAVVMMKPHLLQGRPLLSIMTNELPFVFANRTSWRRLRGLAKLHPALHADKVLHPLPNLLPQPPGNRTKSGGLFIDDSERYVERLLAARCEVSGSAAIDYHRPTERPIHLSVV
jgi:hypothetical protein